MRNQASQLSQTWFRTNRKWVKRWIDDGWNVVNDKWTINRLYDVRFCSVSCFFGRWQGVRFVWVLLTRAIPGVHTSVTQVPQLSSMCIVTVIVQSVVLCRNELGLFGCYWPGESRTFTPLSQKLSRRHNGLIITCHLPLLNNYFGVTVTTKSQTTR